ncbi:MAG: glycine oxidase ThiO [Acidobacteriia bacterium]|nr:glycine oxidase ThiO [Terriglobia bacterium]
MPSHSPDAIIIGAGIIGASICWKLARAGLRVTLLDAGTVGGEASWAGAGMLAPGGEVETRDIWLDLALESQRMYPAYVAELEAESGVSIDYRRCGAVEIAFDDTECQALTSRAALQRPLGIPSQPMDRSDLHRMVPAFDRDAAGAFFYPGDAMVDPRDITRALRTASSAASVEIREGWRAARIDLSADAVRVENSRGDALHAAAAVLAAGAWSSEIAVSGITLPELPRAFPVKGHLTGYQLSPRTLGPILRRGHTYLLQRSSGFTIAGTSTEHVGFDRSVDAQVVRDITARAGELLPALEGERVVAAWAGFRPAADSPGPVSQRAADSRLWLAYGHYRNGILLAPVTADRISREITGTA